MLMVLMMMLLVFLEMLLVVSMIFSVLMMIMLLVFLNIMYVVIVKFSDAVGCDNNHHAGFGNHGKVSDDVIILLVFDYDNVFHFDNHESFDESHHELRLKLKLDAAPGSQIR